MSAARDELLTIIARLETISHVPAVNLDPTPAATTDSKGGARPRGGIDRKDDREPDFALKSADHYRRRLARAHTEGIVLVILRDARATLRAYTHTPLPTGDGPQYGDAMWKRWVAESPASNAEIARIYNVSREYVRQVRAAYRDAA